MMALLRYCITYFAFPLHFAAALIVALLWMELGHSPGLILGVITIVSAIIVAALERIHPFYPNWNRARGDVGVDAIHVVVSQVLVPKYGELLLHLALFGFASQLADA